MNFDNLKFFCYSKICYLSAEVVQSRTNNARVAELVDAHDLSAACLTAVRAGRLKIVTNSMYYTYTIKSLKNNYIYIGISDSPKRRIRQHNKGYNKTTKPYIPFETILIEKFNSRVEARKREKILKLGCGKKFIKDLIKIN